MVHCPEGFKVQWAPFMNSHWVSLKVCGDIEDAFSYLLEIMEGDVSDGFPVRFFP